MSQNWYDKRDIKDQFSWSFKQFKTRLSNLEDTLRGHYQGGNGKAYRVDDYAMSILRRQYELEREGLGVKESSRLVVSEQDNREEEREKDNGKVSQGKLKAKIEYLERENDLLRNRLERQDQHIERLNNRIDNLLPAAKEEEERKDEFKELGLIQVIKKWFTTET